jgi:hypothetical protein
MFTQHSRMALLAGLFGAVLSMPVLAADVEALSAETSISDQPMVVASSPATQPGPVVARESLDPEKGSEVAVVGGSEPTRSATSLSLSRRAARAARAANAGSSGYSYRSYTPSPILGIRF